MDFLCVVSFCFLPNPNILLRLLIPIPSFCRLKTPSDKETELSFMFPLRSSIGERVTDNLLQESNVSFTVPVVLSLSVMLTSLSTNLLKNTK